MGILKDSIQARREATEAMRAIDGNGHVPEVDQAPEVCACCADEQEESTSAAALLLKTILQTQELAYQLAEQLGVSRDELNKRAGLEREAA